MAGHYYRRSGGKDSRICLKCGQVARGALAATLPVSIWPADVLLSLNHDAGYSEEAALPPQNPSNPTTAPRGSMVDLPKQQAAFLISIKKPKAGTDYVKSSRAGVAIGRFLDHY